MIHNFSKSLTSFFCLTKFGRVETRDGKGFSHLVERKHVRPIFLIDRFGSLVATSNPKKIILSFIVV